MKDKLAEIAERLRRIARRIENVGLVRAAEDLRQVANELQEIQAMAAKAATTR